MDDGLEGGSLEAGWEDIRVSGDRRWQLGWGRWLRSLLPVCTCYLPCGGGEGGGRELFGSVNEIHGNITLQLGSK